MMYIPSTQSWQLIDAKHTLTRDLLAHIDDVPKVVTDNQYIVYGWLKRGEAVDVKTVGRNARLADIEVGTTLRVNPVVDLYVNNPNGGIYNIDFSTY